MKNVIKAVLSTTFLFITWVSFGQYITKMPEIEDQTSYETDITKVELKGNYTIISFSYQLSQQKNDIYQSFPFPNQRQSNSFTISINPKSYLSGNGKRFRYLKALNIPELPEERSVYPGEVYRFTVYYERVDPGIEVINLIEGKNSPSQRHQFWNFYGIHIINPREKANSPQPPRVPPAAERTVEPTPEKIVITVKGKILDAKTNQPIEGKVLYRFDYGPNKADSIITNRSGEYSFQISPDAYTFIASAKGYENAQENMDLSKISKSQQFSQNIYLNPIIVEPPKPIEIPKESSPIKVEDNKFRLDKVFFSIGESTILSESYDQLDGLVKMLKDTPTMKIIVEGHTDNVGDPTQNKRLSLERAFNVRDYLIKKGIAGSRIQFKGYGDTKPVADNTTDEGRKMNRRVEFVIL